MMTAPSGIRVSIALTQSDVIMLNDRVQDLGCTEQTYFVCAAWVEQGNYRLIGVKEQIKAHIAGVDPPRPFTLSVVASPTPINPDEIAKHVSLLMLPSDYERMSLEAAVRSCTLPEYFRACMRVEYDNYRHRKLRFCYGEYPNEREEILRYAELFPWLRGAAPA